MLNALTALWVDALKGICAFVEDVQNPTRQGSYQTLVMTEFTGETRSCCRGRGEREEGAGENKGCCLPGEDLPCREGTQGRRAAMWDVFGMLCSQVVEAGVCEFAQGWWDYGEKLMGGHSCVGSYQHCFCQKPLAVLLVSA